MQEILATCGLREMEKEKKENNFNIKRTLSSLFLCKDRFGAMEKS